MDHQVRQRGRQANRVVELRQLLPIRVRHRLAEIHREVAGDVRLRLELLDVILVGLGIHEPIDIVRIIARRVLAMLAELDRETVKRAGMQPVQKPLHDELARRSSREICRITSGFRYFSTVDMLNRLVYRRAAAKALSRGRKPTDRDAIGPSSRAAATLNPRCIARHIQFRAYLINRSILACNRPADDGTFARGCIAERARTAICSR